jgi:hypothetical protein
MPRNRLSYGAPNRPNHSCGGAWGDVPTLSKVHPLDISSRSKLIRRYRCGDR